MRRLRTSIRLLTAGTVAATAVVVLAVPYSQATPAAPGWRIVKVDRFCGKDSLASVVATGPRDAWAAGQPASAKKTCWEDVEHWNGVAWRRVPVPPGLTGTPAPLIAASSPTDAWIFPFTPGYIGSLGFYYNYALHWNGKSWHKTTFPDGAEVAVDFPVAFTPRDAWVFGWVPLTRLSGSLRYAARWDGRAWRKVKVPAWPAAVSALSPDDIWAVGNTGATASGPGSKGRNVALRWTGQKWRTIPLPKMKRPKTKAYYYEAWYLAAVSRREFWWAYWATRPDSNKGLGGELLRRDGARWQQFAVPKAITDLEVLTQDGHGGVWLLAYARTAKTGSSIGEYWYHYTHGRWTRRSVLSPAGYRDTMSDIAWVPRTRSVWSVGEARTTTGKGSVGVIAGFGT
jgi:hypothetical protein